MESAGLWMLVAVAVAMLSTGLPSWVVLSGVTGLFAVAGIGSRAVSRRASSRHCPRGCWAFSRAILLQAMPLYALMGALIHRLPLADRLFASARAHPAAHGMRDGRSPDWALASSSRP
jgi:TRAP-type mannitol/chloroaromatic compound transport system permease large subunit